MPIYDYQCQECFTVQEIAHSYEEQLKIGYCSFCKKDTAVKKIFSVPGIQFKGKGFYKTGGRG